MTPRPAITIDDIALPQLAQLEDVMRRSFDPRFGEAWSPAQSLAVLTLPGYALRVAMANARMLGFAIMRWVADESELLLIAVDPDARGHGTGGALLADWFAMAQRHGARRLFLEMRTDNPALHLYQRYGFAECGRRPGYYRGNDGKARDAITMQRLMVS